MKEFSRRFLYSSFFRSFNVDMRRRAFHTQPPVNFMTPKVTYTHTEGYARGDPRAVYRKGDSFAFRPTIQQGEHLQTPPRFVPPHIPRPEYAQRDGGVPQPDTSKWDQAGEVKSDELVEKMRKAGKLAANCLKLAMSNTKEGATTDDIDALVHELIIAHGAYPSAINFHGFPKSMCSSPNEVACHGIPNNRVLREGDIISYDCTVFLDGVHGDCAGTIGVGRISNEHQRLIDVCKESLNMAISCVKPGMKFSNIGLVTTRNAKKYGYSVIEEFCGHFIGSELHLPPLIPHCYPNSCDDKLIMKKGQVFTIEPLLCEGRPELLCWSDGWTTVTRDNGRCVQWEHTVLVTDDGVEILTLPD